MELIKREIKIEVRNVNEEERSAEFVITDEDFSDTFGTVFKADGGDMARYESNNIVTYMHEDFSKDPDMVLGTSTLIREGKKWVAKAIFEDLENDRNDVADKVFRKIKKGTLKMASIMARAIEGGWGVSELSEDPDLFYFRKWELYSWSVVTHGSNPGALARSASELKFIEENTKNQNNLSNRADDFDARYLTLKYK